MKNKFYNKQEDQEDDREDENRDMEQDEGQPEGNDGQEEDPDQEENQPEGDESDGNGAGIDNPNIQELVAKLHALVSHDIVERIKQLIASVGDQPVDPQELLVAIEQIVDGLEDEGEEGDENPEENPDENPEENSEENPEQGVDDSQENGDNQNVGGENPQINTKPKLKDKPVFKESKMKRNIIESRRRVSDPAQSTDGDGNFIYQLRKVVNLRNAPSKVKFSGGGEVQVDPAHAAQALSSYHGFKSTGEKERFVSSLAKDHESFLKFKGSKRAPDATTNKPTLAGGFVPKGLHHYN